MATDWLSALIAADMAQRAQQQEIARRQQAEYDAMLRDPNSDYNRRLRAAEMAAADQNQFNRNMQSGALDVSRGNLDVSRTNAGTMRYNAETGRYEAETGRMNADTNRFSAETDRAYREALIEQAEQDLIFKYHQQAQEFQVQRGRLGLDTLTLGSQLRGPRDWMAYLDVTAQAGQNPLVQDAVGMWADLTNNRPRGAGARTGPAPQPFDLNALTSDFMGGGGQPSERPRIGALDEVARTGQAAPGWWQSLGSDAQQAAMGYWERTGESPSTILNRLAYTAPTNSLGYLGA